MGDEQPIRGREGPEEQQAMAPRAMGYPLSEAYRAVKSRRPQVNISARQQAALERFEKRKLGADSSGTAQD